MRSKLIISANGPDRKGIVSEISSIININDGNIETSKMIRLETEFALLVLIDINNNKIEILRDKLNQIKSLSFNFIETESDTNNQFINKYHLYINGADNEGIVHSFSKFLSETDINIDEISTKIKNAPMSATPLFMMDVIIGSKSKIDIKNVSKNLNEIAGKLGVDVSIKSA
tara:strand:- start:12990 stop:13505 length:516 start_codon:yes stop_codon:yes gene_type:complete